MKRSTLFQATLLLRSISARLPQTCPPSLNSSLYNMQRRYFTNNGKEMTVPQLRTKIHEQQRDPKCHVLDRIQTQVELVLQLSSSPNREDREEALGRGEALWSTLQPSHSLSSQIPAPSRVSVRIILSESMLECAKSMRDAEQTKIWTSRFRDKSTGINPRDFDNTRQDPMSLFQFPNDGYGHSGVVTSSTGASLNTSASPSMNSSSFAAPSPVRPPAPSQSPKAAPSHFGQRGNRYLDDDDDEFENDDSIDSYVKGKLKAEGVDRRSLLDERRAFEAEEEERIKTASEAAPATGKSALSAFADNPNDDEKTKEAKAKMRKLFGDENSTMNQYKKNVFNEHPMFSRNKPIKWGEAVGPRYT